MRNALASSQEAFTLLEVLVATMILIFVVTSTAALLIAAMTQGMVSRRATEAAGLAQRELERLRDLPFACDPADATRPCLRPGTSISTQRVGAHPYNLERVVSENDPGQAMKRVRITVNWNIRGQRTYVAETVFTNLEE